MAEAAGMRYVQIPMTTHVVPTPAQLAQFLGIVNDPASGPVFVHCVGGRHRTGMMTAAYRTTHHGWAAVQAFSEMKRYQIRCGFPARGVQAVRLRLSPGRGHRHRRDCHRPALT